MRESLVQKAREKRNNKEYAKINRRKKKEYTIELEQKVERLENEVARLNAEVKSLQSQAKYFTNKNVPLFNSKIQKEFDDLDNYRK